MNKAASLASPPHSAPSSIIGLPLPQAVHFRKSTITTGSTLQKVYHYHRQYTRKSTITTGSTLQKVYHYHRQYTSKSLTLPQAVHFRKSTITTGSTLQKVYHYHKQLHLQYTSKSLFSVTLRELFL